MACYLEKKVKRMHSKAPENFKGIIFQCPLIDRQICLWCCLHICELSDPMSRIGASDSMKEYYDLIPKLSDKSWEDTTSVCGRCKNRQ
jgi:hypothetical protein